MQISETALFVFVEGASDRSFYDEVCEEPAASALIVHEVWSAEDVMGRSGGKSQLRNLYESQLNQGPLLDEFKGKRTALVFYFDKDVDDLKGQLISSEHVIYTEYYHLENYLFRHGNIIRAVMRAAAIPAKLVHAEIGDPDKWRVNAARVWLNWVKLCVFAQIHDLGCGCTYRVRSTINKDQFGAVEPAKVADLLGRLESESGMSSAAFAASYKEVSDKIEESYVDGLHDVVFKGEWYLDFLVEASKRAATGLRLLETGLRERLRGSVSDSLDFEEGWTEHFRLPLIALLAQL